MASYDFYRKYQELFDNPRENLLQKKIYQDGIRGHKMVSPRDASMSNDSMLGHRNSKPHPLQEAWEAQREETDMRMSRYRRAIEQVRIKSLQAEELSQPSRALMELKTYEIDRDERLRRIQENEASLREKIRDNTKLLIHNAGIRSLHEVDPTDQSVLNKSKVRIDDNLPRRDNSKNRDAQNLAPAGYKKEFKRDPRYIDHIFELRNEFADIAGLRPNSEARRRPESNISHKLMQIAAGKPVNKSLDMGKVYGGSEILPQKSNNKREPQYKQQNPGVAAGNFRRILKDDEQFKEILLNQEHISYLDSQNPRKKSEKNLKYLLYEQSAQKRIQSPFQPKPQQQTQQSTPPRPTEASNPSRYNRGGDGYSESPPDRRQQYRQRHSPQTEQVIQQMPADPQFRRYKRTPSPSLSPPPVLPAPQRQHQRTDAVERVYSRATERVPNLQSYHVRQRSRESEQQAEMVPKYREEPPRIEEFNPHPRQQQEQDSTVEYPQQKFVSESTMMPQDSQIVDNIEPSPRGEQQQALSATFGAASAAVSPVARSVPASAVAKAQFTPEERNMLRQLTFGKKSSKPETFPLQLKLTPDAYKPKSNPGPTAVQSSSKVTDRSAPTPASGEQSTPRKAAGVAVPADGAANPAAQLPQIVSQVVGAPKPLPLLAKHVAEAVLSTAYTSCLQQEWLVARVFEQPQVLASVQETVGDEDLTLQKCLASQRRALAHVSREKRVSKIRGVLAAAGNKVG